jgi:hypothetical protein
MIHIGFARVGSAVMVVRKGIPLLFDRKPLEALVFGERSMMEIESGDEIPDCEDSAVRPLMLLPDDYEKQMLTDRHEMWKKREADRIAKGRFEPMTDRRPERRQYRY